MEELVKTFHIDTYLILAQLVNFFIVLGVLYKFAYRPVLQLLNERTIKIEKSLDDAKKIEEKLIAQGDEYKKIVADARKEASIIIEKANKVNEERREAMIAKAKDDIGVIINKEKEKMLVEKAEALKDIKKEVAELVGLSLEKLVGKKMEGKADQDLVKDLIKNIKS
ncbi:MAG: F0F1 ATP synthase subunit B [bacterium]